MSKASLPQPRRGVLAQLSRLASALPMPRPGESVPQGLPSLRPAPPMPPARRVRPSGRLRTSLRASLLEGAAAEVFNACAGGAVLTGWALFLGAGPLAVGVLGALPLAAQLFHLPAATLTARYGRKRVALWAVGASRVVWMPLVALPFLDVPTPAKLATLLVIASVGAVLGIVGNNAWTTWMGDLVPATLRGRFFGGRTVYLTVAGTVAALAAAVALDALPAIRGTVLAALAAVAALAALASVLLLARQHEPPGEPSASARLSDALAVLRDPAARPLVRYQIVWNAAVGVAASFFAYHMLENLRMGFVLTAAHGVAIAIVRVITAPLWGRAVDRVGARPVLAVCSLGIATVPLFWLFLTPDRLWPLIIEAIVAGTLWGGHGIAAFDLPFDLSPRSERPVYLAVFATAAGVGFAVFSAIGGVVAAALPATFELAGLRWTDIHVLFLVSAILRLAASMFAHPIPEPGAKTVGALLRGFGGSLRGLGRR